MDEKKLASKKLWVSLLTIAGILLGKDLGLDIDVSSEAIAGGVAAAYVIGQSIVDAFRK